MATEQDFAKQDIELDPDDDDGGGGPGDINDVTAPSLQIVSPANNCSISGNGIVASLAVRIQVMDPGFGVKRIGWTLDGVAQSDNVYDTPVRTQIDLSRTLEVPARSNSAHTLVVSATDDANNTSTATLNFTDVDNTAPFLTITSPQPNAKVLGTQSGAVVTVRGQAEDRQTGTSTVELSPDGVAFSQATQIVSGSWADWQGTVSLPAMAYKVHPITVRTRDANNNSRTETILVEMVRPFSPSNANELLSSRAFLEDLLMFANNAVSTSTNLSDMNARVTGARLQETFYQPFDQLTDTLTTTGSEPVNQLRVAVEVLREMLQRLRPAAHWPFNEGSGGTLADARSSDNVGTIVGTKTWRLGRIRHSLYFDGSSNAVNIASTANSKLRNLVNNFTVAFWAWPMASHVATETQSTTGIAGSNQRYAIVPHQGGTVYQSPDHAGMGVSVGTNGVTVYEHSDSYRPPLLVYKTPTSEPFSGWTHIAIVYKNRQPSLYINGQWIKTGLQSPKSNVHACPEAFGGCSYGRYLGFLDDIRAYDRVLSPNEIAALAAMYSEWVWVEDALPTGATAGAVDAVTEAWNWTWTSALPIPISGGKANTSSVLTGIHRQYFTLPATSQVKMPVDTGDTLFAYVYLDPSSPPNEIMLEFFGDADSSWDHRAYWGANSIDPGVSDSPAHRYVGPLPPTGQWVRLEVPASEVALEGCQVRGFSVKRYNGRVSLDRVGKLKADAAAAFADDSVLASAEAPYRETAYQALLTRIGTSYTEIRMARSADESTRKALADRLGILLDDGQLTKLLLVGSNITESKLEELFGLADTTRDPLVVGQPSWLLLEQRRYLSAQWLVQDKQTGHNGAPIIDPDLITRDDLASAVTGNAANDLYEERRTWLTTTFSTFPGYSTTGQQTTFETHLKNTLLTMTQGDPEWTDATAIDKFLALNSALGQGTNIDAALQLLGLDIIAFRTLVRDHALVANGSNSLLESEWLDVRHILTQMLKRKQYSTWREAEQLGKITLSGEFFRWSPVTPQLPPWRASVLAREAWQETLRTRMEQDRAVKNALQAHIAAAEEIALPILRDVLVRIVGAYQGVPDAAEWLYRRLLVDFKNSGSQRTTRVLQAIETLQGVLFALRAGQFDQTHPADAWNLVVDETAFDQEWRWMSSHEAWRAAMLMFFYSENLLQPNLREPVVQTAAYRLMMQDLRAAQRLTPQRARVAARDFLDRCRASASLEKPGSAPNLAAHWRLDEGVGTALADASVDAPTTSNAATAYGATWVGNALRFDGKDDYVQVNSPSNNGSTSLAMANLFTITAWIYPEGPGSDSVGGGLILNQEPEYKVARFADGTIRYSIYKINPDWGWVNSGCVAPLNRWTHIAIVYCDNGIVKSYANGQLKHTRTGSALGGALTLQKVRMGNHSSASQCFHGFMRDVRVYRAALGQVEIGLLAVPLTDQLNEAQLTDLGGLSQAVMPLYQATPPPATPPLELWREVFFHVPMTLGLWLQQSGEYLTALDWYQTVYAYNLPMDTRKLYKALKDEQNIAPVLSRGARWLQTINPHTLVDGRSGNPYTRYTVMTIARCFLEFADNEFTRDTGESVARARSLYNMARSLLQLDELQSPQVTDPQAFALPNPVLEALRMRADSQLAKLRQGRNIAGMKRQIEIYTPPPTAVSMFPTLGSGSQLVLPGAATHCPPTPYRFSVLLERSKQLVNLAQQMEGAYLAALEKRDAENYNLLQAGHELEVADLTVALQALRVNDAQEGITLATKQQSRAQLMVDTYDKWINAGLNEYEQAMIDGYTMTHQIKDNMAAMDYMITSAQAMIDASNSTVAAGLAFASAAVATLGAFGRAAYTSELNRIEENLAKNQMYASHERRVQEWGLSKETAKMDVEIAAQQALMAQDQKDIAEKEQQIADSNALHAHAVADFLANKFTSAELYEWMSGVLAGVYSYFLQQATAMAQLAENQLKFERQENSPGFIQADYWQVSVEDGSTTDRRGLTGSARLLRDIYQLDQYAFEKDKRKLNLSQTFSLTHLMPMEFQQFRETGTLRFRLSMRLFDQAFPGHYLRLIKRVRTTVIALVPPTQGIRATLRSSSSSSVVVGGDLFQPVGISRAPEMVALTSPNGATGVFEMDAQSDMLLPFEGMGVDTEWELQMPRAANPFNFGSIADVLITIEYTALHDDTYRSQVIKELDRHVSADRTFSLHDNFPDEWYALNNPDPNDTELVVQFALDRRYFPPNVDNLQIEHLMLYVSGLEQHPLTSSSFVAHIRLLPSSDLSDGVEATIASNGVANSRSNPGAWSGITGRSPVSEWELRLRTPSPTDGQATTEVADLFRDGYIKDIVLNITYKGMLPEWPD